MSIFANKRETGVQEPRAQELRAQFAQIPVSQIAPNPAQPRKSFDEETILELASSIEQMGLIQPLVVHRREGAYELVAGERRLRAIKQLGWSRVPCIIQEEQSSEELSLKAIVENLQREDLHYFEEAECYSQMIRGMHIRQEELAERIGKSQSYIANKLRLLRLEPEARKRIVEAGLTERHARALLKLPEGALREAAIERIGSRGLSVKETEKLVDKLLKENESGKAAKPKLIRIFRDYRLFINTVNSACDQLRESGLNVFVEQTDFESGVDITIRVTQN